MFSYLKLRKTLGGTLDTTLAANKEPLFGFSGVFNASKDF